MNARKIDIANPAHIEEMLEFLRNLARMQTYDDDEQQDGDQAWNWAVETARKLVGPKCETCDGAGIDSKNGRQDTCGDCHGSGEHIPMKAALDGSVACIKCGKYLGESQ